MTDVAETLVAKAIVPFQPNMAPAETLAHIASCGTPAWSSAGRPDGVYEWYAVPS